MFPRVVAYAPTAGLKLANAFGVNVFCKLRNYRKAHFTLFLALDGEQIRPIRSKGDQLRSGNFSLLVTVLLLSAAWIAKEPLSQDLSAGANQYSPASLEEQQARTLVAHSQETAAHVIVTPKSKNWEPSQPGKGFTLLSGSATDAGTPFVIRFKFSDGTQIPPHWHLFDEHITVISGIFHIGMGDKFDAAKAEAMPPGSYALMPSGMRHFAWTQGETVIQIHGIGPFKTYWVSALP